MKAKLLFIILLSFIGFQRGTAQIIPPDTDSIPPAAPSVPNLDSLIQAGKNAKPTSSTDSLDFRLTNPEVKYSDDALDAPIDYEAEDSMILDLKNERVYLYGDAVVTHKTLKLTADYIVFNWGESIVEAEGLPDSTGQMSGFPVFEEKNQKFDSKRIRYNFKTNKGTIFEAAATESDLYVLGKKAKFHGGESETGEAEDYVFSENAIFTTCNHPEPHFGIRSRKQKVVPEKVVVVGPSNLEVGGVPTPLWLPFGFFPLKQGQRTGLIFPREYEYSDAWGFGLEQIGWYFPMGDHWDLTLTGNIYTRGTWGLQASSKYRKRYKYNGNLSLGFSDRKIEQLGQKLSNKSYSLRWSHTQDAKAHPTNRFNVSMNIQTNNYQSLNENDAQSVLQNTLSSNASFSKSFPGKPLNFTASMNHSQNTLTRKVDISFPTLVFQMNRIYPFKRKNAPSGDEKWFEKISLQYNANAQNRFTATDTTLFSSKTLEDARFGIKHEANTNASFQLFKYFNVTPSVNYKEVWYFDKVSKSLDPTLTIDTNIVYLTPDSSEFKIEYDTTDFGTVVDMKDYGFYPLRLFNTGVSVSTQIFGIRTFKKGLIRGIRHIIKPSVSFGYTPDYTNPSLGYFEYVDTDLRPEFNEPLMYSIYEDGIYDKPSSSGKAMALSYGINNIFEAKYWSKKDSIDKNFKLFDNVRINGNYNFAKDSLQFSQVSMSGTTRLFNGITTFNFSAMFDPYAVDEDDRRINTFYWDTNRKFLRFEGANFRFNTGLTVKKIRELIEGEPERGSIPQTNEKRTSDDLGGLFENFRISHQLVFQADVNNGRDTFYVRTNSLAMSGNIQLTKKWSVRVGNISYDFKENRLVYPDIGFYRDLHCWEMGMNWQPERGTFSFYLHVKPGSLDFIEVPYKRNNADAFRGF